MAKKNTSAKKKLIPAVAMLTTSAIMLSTATYAWFTMNKEVEVTGLSMSATASDALEISLGARGESTGSTTISGNTTVVAPTDKDVSWTNKLTVGSYYETVGKLIPASSANAVNLFYSDDVSEGGRNASSFKAVPEAGNAQLNVRKNQEARTYTADAAIATKEDKSGDKASGYYIDVPVWLRTSKLQGDDSDANADLYCAIKITRKTPAANNAATEELYKAVRVAFIPVDSTDGQALTAPTSTQTGTTVFGVSDTNYSDKKVVAKAGNKTDDGVLTAATPTVTTDTDSDDYITAKLAQTIPYGTKDSYGEQAFIVRVWLEGENENCWDMTSNQDWNIDFAFSLSEFGTDNKPSFAPDATQD